MLGEIALLFWPGDGPVWCGSVTRRQMERVWGDPWRAGYVVMFAPIEDAL